MNEVNFQVASAFADLPLYTLGQGIGDDYRVGR